MDTAAQAGAVHAALTVRPWEWVAFLALFLLCLGLDSWLNRRRQELTLRAAALQSLLWLCVSLGVGATIWALHGGVAGQEYLTGYALEDSLSLDNVFVWGVVIAAFKVPREHHHTLLIWGVVMSIILRITFITLGVTAVQKFAIVTVLLALFLIYTAVKLARSDDEEFNLQERWLYRLLMRVVAKGDYGTSIATRKEGGVRPTQFGIAIIMFGVVDVLFAVDSVPAIWGVTRELFVIITSNIMALLGLQALYFLFQAAKSAFSKLNEGLAVILGMIGGKMLISSELFMAWIDRGLRLAHIKWQPRPYDVPAPWSLTFIVLVLIVCVIWSILSKEEPPPMATEGLENT